MQFKIILFTLLGFIFLILGAIGVLLPLLPTTPFVLVSVACFSSTPKIKAWVIKNSFFKEHIENYEQRLGLSTKTVLISLSWLWGMLIISMIILKTIWFILLLVFIGVAVTIHILWITNSKLKDSD